MIIALWCLFGPVLYSLLGFVFYAIALSIYSRYGIDDLLASIWFNGKVGAILFWPMWIGLWLIHCIIYLNFWILTAPIYLLTHEERYSDFWNKKFPQWVKEAKETDRWEGAPLWEKVAACRWYDYHSGESPY